jgi:hypothetical protein
VKGIERRIHDLETGSAFKRPEKATVLHPPGPGASATEKAAHAVRVATAHAMGSPVICLSLSRFASKLEGFPLR